MTAHLASRAGLPTPKVYVIPDDSPNAFATGRNPRHAAVARPAASCACSTAKSSKG